MELGRRGRAGRRMLAVAAVAAWAMTFCVAAPEALAATLDGHVQSANAPVAGAFVNAVGTTGRAATVADAAGGFSLPLPDGTYRVSVSAAGFQSLVDDAVRVSGTTVLHPNLSRSDFPLHSVPLFGGGLHAAADGQPGVFYLAGGNVGEVYRSTDWGGTWSQAGLIQNDPASGLPGVGAPVDLVTSGYPGEVAVTLSNGGVYYSTDYGTTWNVVGNLPPNPNRVDWSVWWGHAGRRSVLVLERGYPYAMYVADMTQLLPTFVQMTTPYAISGDQAVAVAAGADRPWLATADHSGQVSVFPLVASRDAPPPVARVSGFGSAFLSLGFGGASTPGRPPAGIVVGSPYHVAMTVKPPGAFNYPPPLQGTPDGSNCHTQPSSGAPIYGSSEMAPDTSGSYGAAWSQGCWIQYLGSRLQIGPANGGGAAIDGGYDATNNSAGSDAVVLLDPTFAASGAVSDSPGVKKVAASSGGNPSLPSDPTLVATAGTGAASGGVAAQGITATTVHQTVFGPVGPQQVASAMDIGGAASDDAGQTFHRATYLYEMSADWWRGASGSWLLFGGTAGQADVAPHANLLSGFENWTNSTPPVVGGNVSGSSPDDLRLVGVPMATPNIDAIAGVPGQDMAFVGTSIFIGNGGGCTCEEGGVRRVDLGPGPSVTQMTPIGQGLITKPGPLAYCGTSGSAPALTDVLLVLAEDPRGGALYRVTGATGPSPAVTKVADIPGTSDGSGRPSLQLDCATGTVLAASGGVGAGLLHSSDGGQTFASVAVPAPTGGPEAIRGVSLSNPRTIRVADSAGYIQRSTDGGRTWAVVNNPATGLDLASAVNQSQGIWDLLSIPGPGLSAAEDAHAVLAAGNSVVAGPGEFVGSLLAPAKAAKFAIRSFRMSRGRLSVGAKRRFRARPRAALFAYSLTARAIVTLTFTQKVRGQRVRRRCRPRRGNRSHTRACWAYRPIRGAIQRTARAGRNTVPFAGRVRGVALPPGTYVAKLLAVTPNGRHFARRTLTFSFLPQSAGAKRRLR